MLQKTIVLSGLLINKCLCTRQRPEHSQHVLTLWLALKLRERLYIFRAYETFTGSGTTQKCQKSSWIQYIQYIRRTIVQL